MKVSSCFLFLFFYLIYIPFYLISTQELPEFDAQLSYPLGCAFTYRNLSQRCLQCDWLLKESITTFSFVTVNNWFWFVDKIFLSAKHSNSRSKDGVLLRPRRPRILAKHFITMKLQTAKPIKLETHQGLIDQKIF